MSKMEPELGQACFGTYREYEMDSHADALLMALLAEVGRVYWNQHQKQWYYEDTGIPGLITNPYDWGDDDDAGVAPNFAYDGVEISWYKYPGRSMSVNKELTVNEWAAWFYKVLDAVRAYEKKQDQY